MHNFQPKRLNEKKKTIVWETKISYAKATDKLRYMSNFFAQISTLTEVNALPKLWS